MDNRFYFGFNASEERKKRRKAELYSMSEQVSTFFWDEAPPAGDLIQIATLAEHIAGFLRFAGG